MRKTLLEMVQSILSDMDSEPVNSISDSIEAQQIASIIEDTFYNIITGKNIPDHQKLIKLTSLSSTARPTHFEYPTNTKELISVKYNVTKTSGKFEWQEIEFVDPLTFISRMPYLQTGFISVLEPVSSVPLVIANDTMPTYYTSFDDTYIIMNAYDASIDSVLQSSKTLCYGSVFPTFTISDAFEPDLDETMLPYLLAESKSACFSLFKGGSDPKVEQSARRLKNRIQDNLYKTKQRTKRPLYRRQ